MSRRFLLPLAMGALLVGGAPALADPNGSTETDNQVTCAKSGDRYVTDAEGLHVYAGGDPTAEQGGSAGVCSEGGAASVVEGRAGISGSTRSGAKIVVDGDDTNENETAKGYLVIQKEAGASAPYYYCGDSEGDLDSDHPTDADTAEDCG